MSKKHGGNIVELQIHNDRPSADAVLKEALGKTSKVLILGETEDGDLYYNGNSANEFSFFLCDLFKAKILDGCINE